MKITADTNILLRTLVEDDPAQASKAAEVLASADLIAVTTQTLCELVWVLIRSYGVSTANVASAIRVLAETRGVVVNRPALDTGLAVMVEGGDFADGVIAYEGAWLGGETFVSFDTKAVSALSRIRHSARLL
ncbi:MAG: type II toxin-antitoxin system VapC family toxin [Rhodanobacteraceae bacterium]